MQGDWIARFEMTGTTVTSSVSGGFLSSFSYVGTANFTSSAGSLAGEWQATVLSSMQITEDDCFSRITSEGTMKGEVQGLSNFPKLVDTGYDGAITTEDCTGHAARRPVSQLTASDLQVPRQVWLVWATCEQAYGYVGGSDDLAPTGIVAPPTAAVAPSPIDVSAEEWFYAYRLSSLDPSAEAARYMEEVEALNSEVSTLLGSIAESEGPISGGDLDALNSLLRRAELLTRSLRRTPACEFIERDGYVSLLADGVARLLQYALANPDRFSAGDLFRLILAGVRTGLFDPRTVSTFGTEELIPLLHNDLARRVEASSDCVDLLLLGQAAIALADGELLLKAEAAAAAACGG